MTRTTTKTRTFPVVLKTLHDDIVRATNNDALTTKAMRVKLRAKMNDVHTHNDGWVFATQSQYDRARSLFDAKYATSIAKPARKPRAKKNDATTNDAIEPVA